MEAPEFLQGGSCRAGNLQLAPEKRNADSKSGENFVIEDLLNFSNEESVFSIDEEGTADAATGNSTYSSTVNSSSSVSDPHSSADREILADANFSGDLCVPYDELAELEWLSNFVEESFSSEDLQKLELISGMKARTNSGASETRQFPGENGRNTPIFRPDVSVPGKARSKRSRAAPSIWSSRLLVLSPSTSSSSENDVMSPKKRTKPTVPKRKDETGEEGRKCLHCATEKTPQWRTGPMGPKTLCNACGVRYKSGRLVPEYRPAASPTFVMTKHSNSHRKVMELRRQKELQQQQQLLLEVVAGDEYLIRHHHSKPDFRRLI